MPAIRLYDYAASGNCLKVRILLGHLGLRHERIRIDIFGGDTLTGEFAARNAARQTPILELEERTIVESSAILWYLAEDSPYLPPTRAGRADVIRWLMFEQERVGDIAAVRFRTATGIWNDDAPEAVVLRARGRVTLATLDQHLTEHPFLADDRYSIADMATYAYVHVAPEAGLELGEYVAVRRWLRHVETQPGFSNDLQPFPANARVGRRLSIYG
jgi:glutathione S-transferase